MDSGHFGRFGAYVDDSRVQLEHAAREARHNREARTVRWLAQLMAGQTYHGVVAIVATAANHVELSRGNDTEDERQLLRIDSPLIACGLNGTEVVRRLCMTTRTAATL